MKKVQGQYGESVIKVPRDYESEFESIVVPKYQSRGLSIERLVINLYAKDVSVSDIELEMQRFMVLISYITNKVSQQAIICRTV